MNKKETILIIGGSGGIGSAVTTLYKQKDYQVILADINEEETKKLAESLNVDYKTLDITSEQSIKDLKDYIRKKYKSLNHIITIAGGAKKEEIKNVTSWEEISNEIIKETLNLNLTGHIILTKELFPLIEKHKNSSIVLTSSINALRAYGIPTYSAAKSGLYGFMIGISSILGQNGIRINTISPGTVPTKRTLKEHEGTDNFERMAKNTTLQKFATPEDIANAAYTLTHILTSTTGQNLVVDSGQSIKIN